MAIKLSEDQLKKAKAYDPEAKFSEENERKKLNQMYDQLAGGGLAMEDRNRWVKEQIGNRRKKWARDQAARQRAASKYSQLQKQDKKNKASPDFSLGAPSNSSGAKSGIDFGQIGGGEMPEVGSGDRASRPAQTGLQDLGIADKTPFAFDPAVDLAGGEIEYGVFRPGEGQVELQRALEQRSVQAQLAQQEAQRQQQAARAGQAELVQALQERAIGQAPTAAEAQYAAAADRAIAQQAALAQGAGGGGLAQRQAAIQAGQTTRGLSQDAAAQALAERQQLAQTAGQLGQGLRGQDLSQQQFQLGQEASYLDAVRQMEEANRGALIEGQLAKVGLIRGRQEASAQRAAARREAFGGLLGGIGSAVATAISDRNKKTNIRKITKQNALSAGKNKEKSEDEKDAKAAAYSKAGKKIGENLGQLLSDKNKKAKKKDADPRSFLDALQAYTYDYKDKEDGKGRQLGVMAQDLEKAGPAGKQMVIDTPEGKMVDYGKGFGAILASTVDMHDRVKNLEKILQDRQKNGNPKKKKA